MTAGTYFLRNTKPTPPGATLEARFEAAVFNTGNYFFEEALQQHIVGAKVIYTFEDLPDDCSTLVLSMSNFISHTTDLAWFADQIEQKKVNRIVMVGAGAQAYDYGDEVNLTEGTLRFARVLSERSTSIGVRGYFTAEVLAKYGITNVDVIGCPTAFWSKRQPIREDDRGLKDLAIHLTPTGYYRDKIGQLFRHGIHHGARYVIQSEQWMMPFMSDEFADRREKLESDYNALYYSKDFLDPARLIDWIRDRSLIFFGMEEWITAMADFDFAYGSRFHGNMAAIQAGTPALNMPYDTRTREMCEYLNLPHIPLVKFDPDMSPARLRELADFSMFSKTYGNRIQTYKEFLERNGLVTRNLDDRSSPGAMQKEAVKNAFTALLDRDLTSGLITKEEYDRELALRLRDDRTVELRKSADKGIPAPAGM